MLKNLFKKQKKKSSNNKNILVTALLIHAAKIDENYAEIEKKIIKKAIIDLNEISPDEAEKMLKLAEKKEKESNQIILLGLSTLITFYSFVGTWIALKTSAYFPLPIFLIIS